LHQPVTDLAPRLIRRLYRKCARRGRRPRRAENERLHALRKSIKTLRYGIEFLAPLYDHEVCANYLKAARKAQGQLGRANDAHGIPRLTEGAAEGDPRLEAAASAEDVLARVTALRLSRTEVIAKPAEATRAHIAAWHPPSYRPPVDGPARAGEKGTPCAPAGSNDPGASRWLPPQLSAVGARSREADTSERVNLAPD
jgi:hypothetical protein